MSLRPNPNPNPRLAPQASVPNGLAPQAGRSGPPYTQRRPLGTPRVETVPLGPVENPPGGRNLHAPLETHTPPEGAHAQAGPPDRPPDTRPQLSPPRSLPWHRPLRPAILPGPNPNPRWRVQDPDPRGLAPNSFQAGQPTTDSRTQPLCQEQKLSSGAVYYPRSGRKQHAPGRPWPLSGPPRALNAGSEEPAESRPQLRPWVRP